MTDKNNNDPITFGLKRFQQTIHSHKDILDKYFAGFDEAANLKGNAKIFLDTNVLLRIYSTSFKAREKLLKFFTDYKERLVLTGQVQWEYIKNREGVINKFSGDVTEKIPANFSNSILSNITAFKENNKSILIDYPEIDKGLLSLEKQTIKLLEEIKKSIERANISSEKIIYQDSFIDLFQKLTLLNPMDIDRLTLIKKEFDRFLEGIEKSDIDKETFKAFPGCYEKKDKSEDPYGDYIIYHEMLDFAKKNDSDIIFLTYDVTKGDWMQKSKSPHLHYVENFYQNTGRMLYILDGQRTFDDLLDINFKSLIKEEVFPTEMTFENLEEFINTYEPFSHKEPVKMKGRGLLKEVLFNKIETLETLKNRLDLVHNFIPMVQEAYPHFTREGLVRGCMHIAAPDYLRLDSDGNWTRKGLPNLAHLVQSDI